MITIGFAVVFLAVGLFGVVSGCGMAFREENPNLGNGIPNIALGFIALGISISLANAWMGV